jgi:hypothetical protein
MLATYNTLKEYDIRLQRENHLQLRAALIAQTIDIARQNVAAATYPDIGLIEIVSKDVDRTIAEIEATFQEFNQPDPVRWTSVGVKARYKVIVGLLSVLMAAKKYKGELNIATINYQHKQTPAELASAWKSVAIPYCATEAADLEGACKIFGEIVNTHLIDLAGPLLRAWQKVSD